MEFWCRKKLYFIKNNVEQIYEKLNYQQNADEQIYVKQSLNKANSYKANSCISMFRENWGLLNQLQTFTEPIIKKTKVHH